jgi:predicted ATPase
MRSLKQAFQEARGGGGVVAIEGEAGVGKTRMLEELIAGAGPNVTVGHARGHGAESGVAYGVITQVLQTVLTPEVAAGLPGSVATELARLLPELGETAEARDHPAAVSRFFEAIRIAIEMGLSRGEEGLLAIDDAHWLDAASIDVLAYFLRRLPAGICVALTWRPEEMGNDRNLQRIVGEAIEEKGGVHIALDRLGRDDVAALVSATHPEADVGVLTDRLMTETEGLPFFVAEYLSASGDDPEWSVPVPVRDLLRDRLDGVSDIGRQVLGTAAVIDRAFDFDTLWRASGRSELEAVDALDELSRWGLVRALDPDEPLYEFSHDKLRTVVLEEMSPVRRRVLHRRIAEALAAAAGRSPASSGAIATHYAAAGAGPEAGRFFTLAGDHARALFAHRDAVAHYEAALGAGVDEPGPLHEAIGDLQVLLGDYLAARLGYERAAASMPEAVARLERKLGEVNLRRGDWDLARAHLERALVDATDERAEVLGDLAIVALRRNDLDAAANHASAAEIEARSAGPDVQAQVENVAGKTAAAAGDVDRARHHLEQSLGLARTAQDEGAVIAALNNLALLHRDTGDNPAAITLTEEALVACRRIGDRHHEAALENNLADLLNASGDRETAMDHLKRATAIFAEIGDEPEGPVPEVWKLVDW